VYAITETGRDEIRDWLRELLAQPVNEYPQFAAALAFFAMLEKEEVVRLLRVRTAMLESQIAGSEKGLANWTKTMGTSRLFLVEAEYGLAMNRAELEWVRGLIRDIQDGKLWLTFDEIKAIGVRLEDRQEGSERG
jgi:hypothetical protein